MLPKVTAIVGVGPGNGLSFARKFAAEGYSLALCSRNGEQMAQYAADFPKAKGYSCDVTSDESVSQAVQSIKSDLGPISSVVYNAGSGAWGNVDQLKPADLTRNMDINATGLMRTTQAVLPHFRESGGGSVVVIGAGAAWRGKAGTLAFAAGKAAQRSVAQSLARHLGPEKVHVSYVIIDGMIGSEGALKRMPDKPKDFFLDPDHIAEAVYGLVQQPPSAWTFELDLRPFGETW